MDWLRENWFWLTVLVLFVVMHAGHGHGGPGSHGGHFRHGGDDDSAGDPDKGPPEGPHRHHHGREGDDHDQH